MFETKEKKIKLVKFLLWKGCIVDFLAALLMSYEAISGHGLNLSIDNSLAYKYAMGFGATMMWGWTVLLYWGTRKPSERTSLLLITAVPVIAGLFTNIVVYNFSTMVPFWIGLLVIFCTFSYGYFQSRELREASI